MESFKRTEDSLRKNHPVAWVISLVSPFLVTLVILLAIGVAQGWADAGKIVIAALVTFSIFGRFVILFGSDAQPTDVANVEGAETVSSFSSAELFMLVTYMDFMTALFIAFNIGILFRLPKIGPKLAGLVADAQFILRMQPWMRRATFLGLVIFVIFPTSTTGSVGGSIFGRLLGLRRLPTLLAILVGSILGNGLMYFFSKQLGPLKQLLQDSISAKVVGVIVVLMIVVSLERWFSVMKKRHLSTSTD